MNKAAMIIDISCDQGLEIEISHATTIEDPVYYIDCGVIWRTSWVPQLSADVRWSTRSNGQDRASLGGYRQGCYNGRLGRKGRLLACGDPLIPVVDYVVRTAGWEIQVLGPEIPNRAWSM